MNLQVIWTLKAASYIVNLLKNVTKTGTAVVMSHPQHTYAWQISWYRIPLQDGHINDVTKEYSKIDLTEDREKIKSEKNIKL